jgi:predicted DNA binding protein
MPARGLASLAKKYGVSVKDAEKHWKQAEKYCKEKGYKKKSRLYSCIMGTTREILKKKKKESFDIIQQLDRMGSKARIYIEDTYPEESAIRVYNEGTSIVYVVPDELFEIMGSTASFGEALTPKQVEILEKKAKKKIIVKEKKPKVRKITDTL